MAALITIKIPREQVSPQEFASLEGLSVYTVYKWTATGKLDIAPKTIGAGKTRVGGRTQILYARYKEKMAALSLGHTRFQIIVGA